MHKNRYNTLKQQQIARDATSGTETVKQLHCFVPVLGWNVASSVCVVSKYPSIITKKPKIELP